MAEIFILWWLIVKKFKQVLGYLLDNAVKFTEHGRSSWAREV
jgi:signal transduction histidine kinase